MTGLHSADLLPYLTIPDTGRNHDRYPSTCLSKKIPLHVGSDPLQVHVVDHFFSNLYAEVLGGMGGISRNLLRSVRT